MTGRISVNADRLLADLAALAQVGRLPSGGISRTSFSPADAQARDWYRSRCAEAGFDVAVDGIGNMMVSVPGTEHGRAAVWSGSHLDTVPDGGHLDGALGSLAALECLRRIAEERIALARPVRAIVYADEEGNYSHLFGSSALVRGFSRAELDRLTGRDGDRFADTFVAAGWDLDRATRTRIDPADVHATVELHIEQGSRLDRLGHQIGVVTAIVGLGGGAVTFRGQADHAGTTPMPLRRDALTAASALIVRFGEIARSVSEQAVITAGIISVAPGGTNVVPGTARLTVDFRDLTMDRVQALAQAISLAAAEVAAEYSVAVDVELDEPIPPVLLDPDIQRIIADAAAGRGLTASAMPSGAGHDSQNLATIAPTGMIFVPSIGGRSHCPEEDTAPGDLVNGANVLLDTIVALAGNG